MKYTYLYIVAFVVLPGCELIVDVDIPEENRKLTLNSVFIQDSVWTAQVSLNRHILDETGFTTLDDCLVVIYGQGYPLDTLLPQGNGMYTGDVKAVAGRTYEVRAASTEYGAVSSQSHIPAPVPIAHVEITEKNPTNHEAPFSMSLELTDPENETNYYQIVLFSEGTYTDYQTGEVRTNTFTVPLQSNEPILANAIAFSNEGLFFTDDLFKGKSVALSLEANTWRRNSDTTKVMFFLRTLSEDYYRYKITAHLQNETAGDPFAQPVSVYNNIENGYGIFGGIGQSVFIYPE